MKKIILAFALLAAFTTNAQTAESLKAQAAQIKVQMDSSSKSLATAMKNTQQTLDSLRNANMQKQAQRSGEMMLQWHNERQAKQKKQMFIYFGLGVFFLVVLVFGLMRKGRARKIS
jgi:predicted RND superfamily exporter protein